jgi:hypothetical protein
MLDAPLLRDHGAEAEGATSSTREWNRRSPPNTLDRAFAGRNRSSDRRADHEEDTLEWRAAAAYNSDQYFPNTDWFPWRVCI